MLSSLEAVADQSGQHSAGPDLDEGADAAISHLGDQVHEADGPSDLLGEALPTFGGSRLVERGRFA